MKRLKTIEVEWLDSVVLPRPWYRPEKIANLDLTTIKSRGFLVARSRRRIAVCSSYHATDTEIVEVGEVTFIPCACIVRMKVGK